MLIVGIVSLVLGLISQLPANVALNWALPAEIETRNVAGTIWQGSVEAVRANGTTVGPVNWTLKPMALLTGKIGASIEAGVPGGFFNGDVRVGPGRIIVNDVKALLALAPLTRMSSIGPSQGSVQVALTEGRFVDLWPVHLDGELQLTDLRYPPVGSQPLGAYRIVFDPADAVDAGFPVAGRLQSISGPFNVDGTLKLGENRGYSMRAKVAASAEADQQMRNSLRIIGPAQADGSYELAFEGNL